MKPKIQDDTRQLIHDWFTQFSDHLRSFLAARVRNISDIDDIVQATFLSAATSSFQPGTNLRAWIFSIAKNRLIDHYRRVKRNEADTLESEPCNSAPSPLDILLQSEEASWLHDCLKHLDQVETNILQDRCNGQSHQAIVERLGLPSVNHSEKKLLRAKTKLKTCIESKKAA